MIQISFATMLMAFLSSSIIVVFTTIYFCNRKFLITKGYKVFALPLGIAALRLLIPVEFSFTSVIALPAPLSQAAVSFRNPFFTTGSLDISPERIIEFIWAIGSIICLGKLIRDQIVLKRMITLYGRDVTHEERYSEALGEICGAWPDSFRIIELPGVKVPVLSGIMSPYVLVPEGFNSVDFRSFLSHKNFNHFHRDVLIKAGINLLMIIYWWNPVCYLLRGQIRLVSEISALLDAKIPNGLTDRFHMLSNIRKNGANLLCVATSAVSATICLLSYCCMFEV